MASDKKTKVGIGVFVVKQGKVLLGKRKNSHGAGQYATPGGHLEFEESIFECARRECREEAGIEIKNIRFLRVSNFKVEGKHYLDIGLLAEWKSGKPQILEVEKCEGWGWYDLDHIPQPLFGVIEHSLKSLKTGQNFFDIC